jgi:exonuclease SbcD
MTNPIRVLHFADIHIGMENYGRPDPQTGLSSRVLDFLHRMDEMIAYAGEHEVDLVIFAGDAFKTRNPNPTYQREFAHRIRDLSQLAPTVLLVGNHDLPPTQMKASSIEIYDTLRVPNVIVASDYELKVVETRRGPVAVGSAPYPFRSRLAELDGDRTAGLTIAETDERLAASLEVLLDDLAKEADKHAMPRLLTGHFTVSGARWGSERSIMLGRDIQVQRSVLADSRWDYVALGHIHKHQSLNEQPPVVYSGSMERIDFGEEGDPKGFCWVELARGSTRWSFVPLPARVFVTLDANLETAANPTEQVLHLIARHDLREAIVRLRLDFTAETQARFDESIVREQLKHAGVAQIAGIQKRVQEPTRARLGGSPEGMTQPELLERYLLSKEVPEERRDQLLELAQKIFEGSLQENELG